MELGKECSSQIVGFGRNWPRNFATGIVTVLVPARKYDYCHHYEFFRTVQEVFIITRACHLKVVS
jgi:hypothetical protein